MPGVQRDGFGQARAAYHLFDETLATTWLLSSSISIGLSTCCAKVRPDWVISAANQRLRFSHGLRARRPYLLRPLGSKNGLWTWVFLAGDFPGPPFPLPSPMCIPPSYTTLFFLVVGDYTITVTHTQSYGAHPPTHKEASTSDRTRRRTYPKNMSNT